MQTFERIAAAAAAIPGVTHAALTSQVPMGGGGNGNGLIPEGVPFEAKNATLKRSRSETVRGKRK